MSFLRLISCAGLIAIFFLSNAEADIFRFRDKEGVWHFSNTQSDARYRLYIRTRGIGGKQYIKEYEDVIRKAAEQFSIEVNLIKAIIKAESSFDPDAISESGAQGLMQLMPDTANDMKVNDPFDPEENIFGGTRYLSLLLQRFNQDKRLAIAAYNVGPTTVTRHNAVPPIPQTRRFVEKVMRFYREFNEKTN
ncbi:MAG: lytic transglycosylase domain-containing protein [Deltaproteobacteria bacterium]|nr:lytic transglycosylase domain-containing protein [Deltaproteobacteria bacterium]MBW2339069.1 lytic transglycosylase domain-containing protein [Deltaproteobacteria bacterium]